MGEKLPNLGYATLIDLYVLLCFIIAFVIGILQCPVAIGYYTEPIVDVNKTEADGETRIVQVPVLGVALLVGWAGLHALLFCVAIPFRRFLRERREPFWRLGMGKYKQNAAWIGPAAINNGANAAEIDADVRALLEELRQGKMLKPGEKLKDSMKWDEKHLQRVLVWSPKAIIASMKSSGFDEKHMPHQIDPEKGAGFIVVVMESYDDVLAMVAAWRASTCADSWKDSARTEIPHTKSWAKKGNFKIEPLDIGWAPLTISRTYSRRTTVPSSAARAAPRQASLGCTGTGRLGRTADIVVHE